MIDTDAGPAPFADRMDDWQDADFRALDSGWKRAVLGAGQEAQFSRGWLERPRGHSKSLDLGIMAAWALFASRRRLSGIGAAGDQDQARILRDAIGRLCYVNPWLAKLLEVQGYRVVNPVTESCLEIITSDAPTSYGLTPDFVIADEVCHWRKARSVGFPLVQLCQAVNLHACVHQQRRSDGGLVFRVCGRRSGKIPSGISAGLRVRWPHGLARTSRRDTASCPLWFTAACGLMSGLPALVML